MNQLPQVLRLEIWEYVRGDRTFWRHQFQHCLGQIIQPWNIRHRLFDEGTNEPLETEFESINLDRNDIPNATHYPRRADRPIVRTTEIRTFTDGILWFPYADIVNGLTFIENVPELVFLRFGAGTQPIPLKPIGRHVSIPWVSPIATWQQLPELMVVDRTKSFPCELTCFYLEDLRRTFIANSRIIVSFQIGSSKVLLDFHHGFVKVASSDLSIFDFDGLDPMHDLPIW